MVIVPAAPLNMVTDVRGLRVGNVADERLRSGVTVVVFDRPAVASVAILGGAPGERGAVGLEPGMVAEAVDALVLAGGSAFGLDAVGGVEAYLRRRGRGLVVGDARVPIVAGAILFDLLNGGDKSWGRYPPYREMAYEAAAAAEPGRFALGSVGAGYGATTVDLKGGLGSASAVTSAGHAVGAVVAVNALGSAVIGGGPHFWAAPFEIGSEFGGLGWPSTLVPEARALAWKGGPGSATTLAIVATDATLTHAMTKRLAIAANDGLARGLRLAHALYDGDLVFAASTGRRPLADPFADQIEIGAVAADCITRAIARAVFEATTLGDGWPVPAWRDRFGPL